MKKKILKLIITVFVLFFGFFPISVFAVDFKPILQITIPNIDFSDPYACGLDDKLLCIPWIAEYIIGVYKYGVGIGGILAAIVLMWGGVLWLTAGGNQSRVGEAQNWIKGSITGLVLLLSSYVLLYQINPDLLNLKPVQISEIQELPMEDEYLYEDATDYAALMAGATIASGYSHVKFSSQAKGDLPILKPNILRLLKIIDEAGFDVAVTCAKSGHSLYTKSGELSRHGMGLAVDFSASRETLIRLSTYLYENHRALVGESIYSYNKEHTIQNGKGYTLTKQVLIDTHRDHLHLAGMK
jgi:hypothetical protein